MTGSTLSDGHALGRAYLPRVERARPRTGTPSDGHALGRACLPRVERARSRTGTHLDGRICHGSSGHALGRARPWTGGSTTGWAGRPSDGHAHKLSNGRQHTYSYGIDNMIRIMDVHKMVPSWKSIEGFLIWMRMQRVEQARLRTGTLSNGGRPRAGVFTTGRAGTRSDGHALGRAYLPRVERARARTGTPLDGRIYQRLSGHLLARARPQALEWTSSQICSHDIDKRILLMDVNKEIL